MREADFNSQAEYYRAHGAALRLAMELGCTPVEAEFELKRRAAVAAHGEAVRRYQAKANAPLPSCSMDLADDPIEPFVYYWQRED